MACAVRRARVLREAATVPVQGGGHRAHTVAPPDAILPPRHPQPCRPRRELSKRTSCKIRVILWFTTHLYVSALVSNQLHLPIKVLRQFCMEALSNASGFR